MSWSSKDSAEVVKFMTLLARLKDWSDDAPKDLVALVATDAGLKKLCTDLSRAAHVLQMHERMTRIRFATPVDPVFLAAWRDYEERYKKVIAGIWLSDLLPELEASEPSNVSNNDFHWDWADDEAKEAADWIEEAIDFAKCNIEPEARWAEDPEYIERVENGIGAWDRLKRETGFDVRGVLRRQALIPFVLVPRNVAAKHDGSGDKLSLFENLQQAHDAFVFGATHAALALMRSIMEAMLRDHYRVEGKDLRERIDNARSRLPRGVSGPRLHRLRKLANAVLHLGQEKDEGLPKLEKEQLEKELISLLFALRTLIEGAK